MITYSMSASAIKRILKRDIKSIQTQKLNDMGIFIEFDEQNMLCAKAMILGPVDSAYRNGIFFFDIEFPTNYPYSPPRVSYISRGSIRIHPNLYTGSSKHNYLGKVCLSILGTWSGPQWTTIMDISSVLLSIQSLLDNNPLDHEPGFSGKKMAVHDNYKRCVEYETIRTLILKNTSDIPEPFLCFKPIIQSHFNSIKQEVEDYLFHMSETETNEEIMFVSTYHIRIVLNYKYLLHKLKSLKK